MIALRAILTSLCFALAMFACESPIVGLQCRPGFSVCGDSCVDLSADFRHCGECDHSCGRFVCEKASCSAQEIRDGGTDAGHMPDGGSRDAGHDAGADAGMDAGQKDAGRKDAGADNEDAGPGPDASLPGCSVGYIDCGGVCVNPTTDPKHCGACEVACGGAQRCSRGHCADQCDSTETECGGLCFDVTVEPDHCGQCEKRCNSGICTSGACADAIAGQAVVIGHDFTSANTAMQRLVGNAVFLGMGAPVRVLVYTGNANPTSVLGVEGGIDMVKAETGRDWVSIPAHETLVTTELKGADVFLIHAQVDASNSTLRKLRDQWGQALWEFVTTGHVIVVIEAPSAVNTGTFQVLKPPGCEVGSQCIFIADGRDEIPTQALTVKTPGLGVAVRVPDRYMSLTHSVHFNGVNLLPGSTEIVVDRDNLPVVVQRVISPR